MDTIYKVAVGRIVEKSEGKPIVALVSTPDVDLVGDVILPLPNERGNGWDVADFNARGGRIFWMHDQWTTPNLARAKATPTAEGLLLEVDFDLKDQLAATLDRKYREGYLSEWSVGFAGVKADPNDNNGMTFYESRLMEVSAVNAGMNPHTRTMSKADDVLAAMERRLAAIEDSLIARAESSARAKLQLERIAEMTRALRA